MPSPHHTEPGDHAPAEPVRNLAGAREIELALGLREAVFCGEQGVSLAAERDGRDGEALHLGVFSAGALVGACRLLPVDGGLAVQRVAVRADRRRAGIGRALMGGAAEEARRLGVATLRLHAQLETEGFYRRLDFVPAGQPFLEAGILHVAMSRQLPLS